MVDLHRDQRYTIFMSPTVFRAGPHRFFFFSREEARMHVHVVGADGEAKFWIEPIVSLATYSGYNPRTLRHLLELVQEREDEIREAWQRHFG